MNSIQWAGTLFLRYPYKTLFVIVTSCLEVVLFMFPISITADIIDIALQGGDILAAKGKLYFLLGIAFIQAIIFFLVCFINEILAHRISTDMTYALFKSLQFRSLTYHDTKNVGEIMARATGDTRTINIAISPAIRIILEIATVWVVVFVITLTIHFILALFTFIAFLLFIIASIHYSQRLIAISTTVREKFAGVSEVTSNSLTGIREIKSSVSEYWIKKRFMNRAVTFQTWEIKAGTRGAWFYPMFVVTFFGAGLISMALLFASIPVLGFAVTLKEVVLIAGVISLLLNISDELGWAMEYSIRAFAGNKRIHTILSEQDPAEAQEGQGIFQGNPASIEFRNVSFRYRSDLPYALNNISFHVKENQTIAIVGGPGSGKSSITKLIQHLYSPTSGNIYLGGLPINHYTNDSIRKHISTVEQDVFLFNISVKENIRYGNPSATDTEVITMSKLAEAHDFIMEMPKGFDTIIGEGGIRLSGGQAQRLSIARALLVNPSVLVMDDGASALDARTEIRIQAAISEILRTRTTIITTHRLSIISKADIVLMLENGKIVGLGTHESLIKSNRYYRRLFERHYELPPIEQMKNEVDSSV